MLRIIQQGLGEVGEGRLWALFLQQPITLGQQLLPPQPQLLLGPKPPGLALRQGPLPLSIEAALQLLPQQIVGPAEGLKWQQEPTEERQAHGLQVGPRFAADGRHRVAVPRPQPHPLSIEAPSPQLWPVGGQAIEMAALGSGRHDRKRGGGHKTRRRQRLKVRPRHGPGRPW